MQAARASAESIKVRVSKKQKRAFLRDCDRFDFFKITYQEKKEP